MPFCALRSLIVAENISEKRKAAHRAAFVKEAKGRKENLSGKAMQDEVPACAKTHGLKKSKSLEEG